VAAATGAGAAAGGSAFINPGMKNEAGEILPLALMPEHPAPSNAPKASIASQDQFQFNLTSPV
jgi:hypothetical protein